MDQRNFMFMFYGFAAAWAVICLYVVSLVLRQRKTRAQLESLRRMVEDREK